MEFIRFCELIIGPLAEHQARNDRSAIRIIADGSNQRLRVAFSSAKSLTGEPNKTAITIYNLSRETRQALRANLTRVRVVAGYTSDEKSAGLVASGALLSAITVRQGADIVTQLVVLDGYGGMVYGAYSRSFSGGTPLRDVVRDIAQSMPGVDIGELKIEGNLPAKGVALAGMPSAQLNKLADQNGFSWSVQNGTFQAIGDNTDSGRSFSFDSEFNLMQCSPLLNGPLQIKAGVEIVAKFDSRMVPGDRMNIRSIISPDLSGTYKVTSTNLQFDSHGPAALKAQSMAIFTI